MFRNGKLRFGSITGLAATAAVAMVLLVATGAPVQAAEKADKPAVNVDCDPDGCVGADDIGTDAVDADAIATGAVGSSEIENETIQSEDIKNGAVGADDIADGAIGAAQLGLSNTIYVEDTGTPTDNCTDLLAALSGLTGPAAVVLGPGAYDCGTSPVVLPAQVSLIGSGQNLTTITGSVQGDDGLVRLQGDGITLRELTVVNDDSEGAANRFFAVVIGAGFVDTRDWRISDMTAEAKNGNSLSIGIHLRGVDCDGGEITDVTAMASGPADNRAINFECGASSVVTASNLTASASTHGLIKFTAGSSLTVRNSSFTGTLSSVSRSNGTLKVISSELDGPVVGAVTCVGAYDENGAALIDGFFGDGLGGCE
jgi:hypothetical protein